MVLAMFSHVNLIHLGCNMMVLWSFLPLVVPLCGHEQTLALYLSGGVFASFFSKLIKVLSHVSTPSVGAVSSHQNFLWCSFVSHIPQHSKYIVRRDSDAHRSDLHNLSRFAIGHPVRSFLLLSGAHGAQDFNGGGHRRCRVQMEVFRSRGSFGWRNFWPVSCACHA